jgi:hypothetical protein
VQHGWHTPWQHVVSSAEHTLLMIYVLLQRVGRRIHQADSTQSASEPILGGKVNASTDTRGALGAPSTTCRQETRPRIVNLEERLGAIEAQAARTAGWEGVLSSNTHSRIQEQLYRLLQSLSAAERRLLTLRFGLNGAPPKTLEQVSSQLRLSLPTVQEQERQALQRLRHAFERSA